MSRSCLPHHAVGNNVKASGWGSDPRPADYAVPYKRWIRLGAGHVPAIRRRAQSFGSDGGPFRRRRRAAPITRASPKEGLSALWRPPLGPYAHGQLTG